jgi:mono/diheme cytochrome c family protein
MRLHVLIVLSFMLAIEFAAEAENAAQPTLVISRDKTERQFTAAELLASPNSADVTVQVDLSGQLTSYRAVPLLPLLGDIASERFDTLEGRATDGFVSQIPLALIGRGATGGAVPWIAVEDPAHPWLPLPRQTVSAGPFYLIWEHPERSGVRTEQWPYQLVSLTFVESPVHRWPQLAVPPDLPPDAEARRGQEVFLTQCFPCHRMNEGGAAEMGPDLGRPMNPTQYLTDAGLRAIIRNTRAVRTWPAQQMMNFDQSALPDADLDAVVAYLHAMAEQPRAAPKQ